MDNKDKIKQIANMVNDQVGKKLDISQALVLIEETIGREVDYQSNMDLDVAFFEFIEKRQSVRVH
jgi:hypothetical protein